MQFDLLTFSLIIGGAIGTTSVYFSIKLFRSYSNANSKAVNGDSALVQTGSVQGTDNISAAATGKKNTIITNTGSGDITLSSRKYSATEKMAAFENIKQAFKKYFYTFLGNELLKGGMLNHSPHLDKNCPKKYAAHYEQIARSQSLEAKRRLKKELNQHARFLENSEAECKLANECKKLVSMKNDFEITDEMRSSVLETIENILADVEIN